MSMTDPPPAGWCDYLGSQPRPWKRSAKGNLYRRWLDLTLTVFQRQDGRYGWCISPRRGEPRFSRRGYATEDEAADAVWAEANREEEV